MSPMQGTGVVWLGKKKLVFAVGEGSVADSGVALGKGWHWAPVSPTAILAGFGSRDTAGP